MYSQHTHPHRGRPPRVKRPPPGVGGSRVILKTAVIRKAAAPKSEGRTLLKPLGGGRDTEGGRPKPVHVLAICEAETKTRTSGFLAHM